MNATRAEAMDVDAACIDASMAPAALVLFICAFLRVLQHTADVLVERRSVGVCLQVVHAFCILLKATHQQLLCCNL
jgi:hypothetical protein